MEQNEVFLLVPTTTFANGNVETTIIMCNELDWWKRGLRYSPPHTANDYHTKTRHSASVNPPVQAGSLFREALSLYVNMNNMSDTRYAGFGVISCSVMTVVKGFRSG